MNDSGAFAFSCADCTGEEAGPGSNLTCSCQRTFGGPLRTTLDLGTYLFPEVRRGREAGAELTG